MMKRKLYLMLRVMAVLVLFTGVGIIMTPGAKAAPAEKVINFRPVAEVCSETDTSQGVSANFGKYEVVMAFLSG